VDVTEIYILESGPFLGHATLEELPPSKLSLLVNKAVECAWESSFIDGAYIEP
jgi:hypothetical protein